jgi:hypothetical protein
MRITKRQLRQIIKEELEIDSGQDATLEQLRAFSPSGRWDHGSTITDREKKELRVGRGPMWEKKYIWRSGTTNPKMYITIEQNAGAWNAEIWTYKLPGGKLGNWNHGGYLGGYFATFDKFPSAIEALQAILMRYNEDLDEHEDGLKQRVALARQTVSMAGG